MGAAAIRYAPIRSVRRIVGEAGEDAAMLARLTRDLPRYLRTGIGLDDARRLVQGRLATREGSLLRVVERAIYRQPRSPYLALLRHAGCELGDLQQLIGLEGIEGALTVLSAKGVYITFDELKGRRPAVRGSARFTFSDRDFDNPLVSPHYPELTGGSGGRPSRVGRALGSVTDQAASFALAIEAHGIHQPRNLFWIGQSASWALVHLKLGHQIGAWYYPTRPSPLVARIGIRYVGALARLAGRRLPVPTFCDLLHPEPIVRWLVEQAGDGRSVIVNTHVSAAVRTATAAMELGRRLTNVTFLCRSEPLSAPRRRLVEDAGAHALASYASVELASHGYGCQMPVAADDVHLHDDRLAVVKRRRPTFEGGPETDALLFTTLSPFTPKIGLNTELGDTAHVERRDCGCPLGSLGLRTHLSEIRSFEKLSSEGTSFTRGRVLEILEERLPARFGGTALDYQLVEEEGRDGSTVLVLHVHPAVVGIDDAVVRAVFLEELSRGSMADAHQARLIERAQAIVVRRFPPAMTRVGKILPFQPLRHAASVAERA